MEKKKGYTEKSRNSPQLQIWLLGGGGAEATTTK
jgi:hypothetical protein